MPRQSAGGSDEVVRRYARRKTAGLKAYGIIVLVALVLPLSINFLWTGSQLFGGVGERVATFAAVLGMPDAGLDLLRERFRSELYPPSTQLPQIPTLPLPQPSPPQEDEDVQEEEAKPSNDIDHLEQSPPIQPRIPAAYRAQLVSENFAGRGGDLIRIGEGFLRNDTKYDNQKIEAWLQETDRLVLEGKEEPLVLIYHTHATESFERYDSAYYDTRNTWRSTDNNNNMVAVGAAMAHALEKEGIGVIHDTTQHDYPSYNGSYERSAKTIQNYLQQFPSIKIVLDLHRDAMERENQTIVKPVVEIAGKKAAQIMIVAGADNGSMGMEHWRQNMRFACDFQNAMERNYPQLTRPILLSHRKYNQHLSTGALLVEFGSNANTLEEAIYSAEMAGYALAELINQSMEDNTPS